MLKRLHVFFIFLGRDTLSAPTVHEVLGGNPRADLSFIHFRDNLIRLDRNTVTPFCAVHSYL